MMRVAGVLLALVALASCGADGAPEPREGGIQVSGSAQIGVKGRF